MVPGRPELLPPRSSEPASRWPEGHLRVLRLRVLDVEGAVPITQTCLPSMRPPQGTDPAGPTRVPSLLASVGWPSLAPVPEPPGHLWGLRLSENGELVDGAVVPSLCFLTLLLLSR